MTTQMNAWRRMIWEDQRAPESARLDFVVHLGDFIYEVVEYPDEVKKRYDRTVYEVCRIPDARKVGNFHAPLPLTTPVVTQIVVDGVSTTCFQSTAGTPDKNTEAAFGAKGNP